jgi:hypothetical protein
MNQLAFRGNTLVLAICQILWMGLSAHAALLVYEEFDYPAGCLAGQNGGAGWNGGWVDAGGAGGITVVSGNLTAGAHSPTGYDARSTGNLAFVSNANRIGRWLDCSTMVHLASHELIDTTTRLQCRTPTIG